MAEYITSPKSKIYEVDPMGFDECLIDGVHVSWNDLGDWTADMELFEIIDALEDYAPGFIDEHLNQ